MSVDESEKEKENESEDLKESVEAEGKESSFSAAQLKMASRRRRVLEFKCRGFSVPQICAKLNEDGYVCSESTIYNDLHSDAAGEVVEELIRQQLIDITFARQDHPVAAMRFRDLLIEKLLPEKNVGNNVRVNVNVNQQPERTLASELLANYERIVKAGEVGDIQRNNIKQPLDSSKANPQADAVPEKDGN